MGNPSNTLWASEEGRRRAWGGGLYLRKRASPKGRSGAQGDGDDGEDGEECGSSGGGDEEEAYVRGRAWGGWLGLRRVRGGRGVRGPGRAWAWDGGGRQRRRR